MTWSWRGRPFEEARRLGLALLLLAAVVLRAGVPAGWMPDARDGGLVICTGHGELVLRGGSGPTAPQPAKHHEPCAFSGLGSAPTPDAPALTPPASVVRPAAEAPVSKGRLAVAPRHRDQAARAPPRPI